MHALFDRGASTNNFGIRASFLGGGVGYEDRVEFDEKVVAVLKQIGCIRLCLVLGICCGVVCAVRRVSGRDLCK